MRNPLFDDEFEGYLQQQAKQHRLYPSDQIWRNIQESLHGNTRWPALAIVSVIIIAALVTITILFTPDKAILESASKIGMNVIPVKTDTDNRSSQEVLSGHLSPELITQNTIASVTKKIQIIKAEKALALNSNSKTFSINANELLPFASVASHELSNAVTINMPLNAKLAEAKESKEDAVTYIDVHSLTAKAELPHEFVPPVKLVPDFNLDEPEVWRATALPARNTFKSLASKLSYQFYVTPSVSYRRLLDDKNGSRARSFIGVPANANYAVDVNKVVRHRPSIGVEVGFAAGYSFNNSLTLKTGLQFNVRQYNIDAYSRARSENAAVALFENNAVVDTINVASRYRNFNTGSMPVTISNNYYEISIPVGIDWKVFEGKRIALHVATALQPTYTFDKKPFIITSDYKNYADGSLLMRNWNLNTSIETYLSYRTGNMSWQIGPQFRYQQLPTFSNNYPIKEYLLDYGIKLGFTRTFK